MITDFISITNLQRNISKVFSSKKPFQIVLSNNAVKGIVIPTKPAKALLESGMLEQLREELWELNDAETIKLVEESRKGRGKNSKSKT